LQRLPPVLPFRTMGGRGNGHRLPRGAGQNSKAGPPAETYVRSCKSHAAGSNSAETDPAGTRLILTARLAHRGEPLVKNNALVLTSLCTREYKTDRGRDRPQFHQRKRPTAGDRSPSSHSYLFVDGSSKGGKQKVTSRGPSLSLSHFLPSHSSCSHVKGSESELDLLKTENIYRWIIESSDCLNPEFSIFGGGSRWVPWAGCLGAGVGGWEGG